jgi:Ca-activated chloride channel family protein
LAAYVVLRGAAATRAFTNLELLERSPAWPGWYRHVPAAALIVALAL